MRERESTREKRKRLTNDAAQHVWEKRKRERWACMCVRKHTIRVTCFLALDWLRR
jgi:hypothetical protein